jgi:hypothetical protein
MVCSGTLLVDADANVAGREARPSTPVQSRSGQVRVMTSIDRTGGQLHRS